MGNPHAGHRERMRNQYQSLGLNRCSDLHLLEMLLFYALPRIDTNVIAHALLDKFKNFNGILSADREEILSINGVGENVWLLLKAINLASDMLVSNHEEAIDLSDKKKLYDYFYSSSYSSVNEYLNVVFLNYRMEIMSNHKFSFEKGKPFIPERELKNTFAVGEKYCVVAHVRPNSSSRPTSEDIEFAYSIAAYLSYSQITLKDFLIVGKDGIFSAINYKPDM